jgi:hypothetical protein
VDLDVKYFKTMIKKEWHFMQRTMNRKKLIQKLQQLSDKLPKGKERKAIRERLLNLKLNKNKV